MHEPQFQDSPGQRIYLIYAEDSQPLGQWLEGKLAEKGHFVLSLIQPPEADDDGLLRKQRLDEAEHVVPLLSRGALSHDSFSGELIYAFNEKKRILPLFAEVNAPIPLVVQNLHCLDFTTPEVWERSLNLLLNQLGADEHPPNGQPEIPGYHVERRAVSAAMRSTLLNDDLSAKSGLTVLCGRYGCGKSELLAALAHDAVLHNAYSDGIALVQVKDSAEGLLESLRQVGRQLGDIGGMYTSTDLAQAALTQYLTKRKCLILLDEVWKPQQVTPFTVQAQASHWLVATENDELSISIDGGVPILLDAMTPPEAVEMLKKLTGQSDPVLARVAESLECWPAVLRSVGGRLSSPTAPSPAEWLEQFTALLPRFTALLYNLPAGRWIQGQRVERLLEQQGVRDQRARTRLLSELVGLGCLAHTPASGKYLLPNSRVEPVSTEG